MKFVKGGSNMTGTNCDLFTHNQSRSYFNHLVCGLQYSMLFDFCFVSFALFFVFVARFIFLGAFAKLRKATNSFVMSIRPYVRLYFHVELDSHLTVRFSVEICYVCSLRLHEVSGTRYDILSALKQSVALRGSMSLWHSAS